MPKGHTHKNKKTHNTVRATIYMEPGSDEDYAKVTACYGDARFKIMIDRSGDEKIAKARGALTKGKGKRYINIGDIVLVQKCVDKYYILLVYTSVQVKELEHAGELHNVSKATATGESSVAASSSTAAIVFAADATTFDKELVEPEIDIGDI
jgi:hypothetical protein